MKSLKYLDEEKFISLMKVNTSLETNVIKKTIDDFNKKLITFDQVKAVIKTAKKTSIDEFLNQVIKL
jgi:hypothetical protein